MPLITILMAEDDADDRLMTREAFQECRLGNPLQFVADGEELMDYLNRRGQYADIARYPMPGLILLDLNMPRKDGREALREIKADPALRDIPVVVLTTSKAVEDVSNSYCDGANSFITKPVSFAALIEVVQTLGKYWLQIVDLPPPGQPAK
jgi:CheY-like chemotaxis protein